MGLCASSKKRRRVDVVDEECTNGRKTSGSQGTQGRYFVERVDPPESSVADVQHPKEVKRKCADEIVYTDIGDYKEERVPRRKRGQGKQTSDQIDIDPDSVEGILSNYSEQLRASGNKTKMRTLYMPSPANTIPVGVKTACDPPGDPFDSSLLDCDEDGSFGY